MIGFRKRRTCFGLFAVLVASNVVMADEMSLDEALHAHQVRLVGATTPELIPFYMAMRTLLRHFDAYSTDLRQQVSDQTFEILKASSRAERIAGSFDNSASEGIWDGICRDFEVIDAVEIARRVESVATAFRQTRTARYEHILGELDSADSKVLLDFLQTRIKPTISVTNVDAVALATEVPARYKAQMRSMCEQHVANQSSQSPASETTAVTTETIELSNGDSVKIGKRNEQ